VSVARAAEAAAAPLLRARAGEEAGGGVAPLPPLLLPLLGDPVDMAEILAVRRVTLSSSSSIGGPAEAAPGRGIGGGGLIFFPFFFEIDFFSRPLSSFLFLAFLVSRGSLDAFFCGLRERERERESKRGFEEEQRRARS